MMDGSSSGTRRRQILNQAELLEWIDNSRQASASDGDLSKDCLDGANLASALHEACLRLYAEQWRAYCQQPSRSSNRYARLREQLGFLLLWGETFKTSDGSGYVDGLPDFRDAVLEVLCNVGKTLIRSSEATEIHPKDSPLAVGNANDAAMRKAVLAVKGLLEKASLLECSTAKEDDPDPGTYTSEDEDTSDLIYGTGVEPDSSAITQTPSGDSGQRDGHPFPLTLHKFGDVRFIKDMEYHIACLQDIAPTLEQMLEVTTESQRLEPATVSPIFHVSDPARPFVLHIHDKYRQAPKVLVERLGEANWQRFVKIRNQMAGHEKNEEETEEQGVALSTFQPVSKFHDSGLGASMPTQSSYAPSAASHTSFLSSHVDADGGTPRVPPTPEEVAEGRPFVCFICGQTLTNIKNRVGWKIHVFKDLQPYICTFGSCHDMLVTFPTKKLWYDHEYSVHRHRQSFSCYRCHEVLDTEAAFRTHLDSSHTDYLNEKQLRAAVSAARSTMQNPIGNEECPLCLKPEWTSVRAFTTHVARHMEGIALASLPKSEDTDSEHEDEPQSRQNLEGFRINGLNSSPSTDTLPPQPSTDGIPGHGGPVDKAHTFAQVHQEPLSQINGSGTSATLTAAVGAAGPPVRPSPPYDQFIAQMTPQLIDDNYPQDQMAGKIKELWDGLTRGEQGLWGQRYRDQMVDYETDMDKWKREQRKISSGVPSVSWQAGPPDQQMMRQQPQSRPPPIGTPGQRSDMPPGPGPAAENANANRTPPLFPQPGQAPPTPSQSSKPAPEKKRKDETRENAQIQTKRIQRQIHSALQQQGPHSGWQATVTVEQRANQVKLFIDSLRPDSLPPDKPILEPPRAVQIALSFEQKAFMQSPSQDAYVSMCKDKLSQVHDTVWQQQNTATLQNDPHDMNTSNSPLQGSPNQLESELHEPALTAAAQTARPPVGPGRLKGRAYVACDACRRRKVKCDFGDGEGSITSSCLRCRREHKDCIVTKTRNPPMRSRGTTGTGTSQTSSPPVLPATYESRYQDLFGGALDASEVEEERPGT